MYQYFILFYCQVITHCMYHIIFVYSSIHRHLPIIHFLAIMNSAALDIHVQAFMWTYVRISLEYICSNGIAELHVLQRSCTILHSFTHVWGSQFLYLLPDTWYCLSLVSGLPYPYFLAYSLPFMILKFWGNSIPFLSEWSFRFIWCFLTIRVKLSILGQNTT